MFRVLAALILTLSACADNDFQAIARNAAPYGTQPEMRVGAHHVARIETVVAADAALEWCGESLGHCRDADLHAMRIFQAGAQKAADSVLTGAAPATLKIEITEFDSISGLERVTLGGIHYIGAVYQLVDASGAALTPPTVLDFDAIALSRAAALIAAMRGRTRKVRVTERVEDVTRAWLTTLIAAQERIAAGGAGGLAQL